MEGTSKKLTMSDGVTLHIQESGQGPTWIFLAGGGFSGDIFQNLFPGTFHIIAPDMRSHGKSDVDLEGMRIDQFARDVREIIEQLDLQRFSLLGHSLGCSVIYSYCDQFGFEGIDKVVLIDEPAVLTADPSWSKEERLKYGATYDKETNEAFLRRMNPEEFGQLKKEIVEAMTTESASAETKQFIESCFVIDPEAAKRLYRDNLSKDWREIVPRMAVPCLIVGGKASITPWQSQQWIHQMIPNSHLALFEKDEGGSHFLFVENPSGVRRELVRFEFKSH